MSFQSTLTQVFCGNGNSDPLTATYAIDGDSITSIDADMTSADNLVVELAWSAGKLNAIFILVTTAVELIFNWDSTSPQTFWPADGGVFSWDIGSGIPCPITGAVHNLKLTRTNPSDGDGDVIKIRFNKDATP